MAGWVDVDAVDADGGSISRISLPSRRQPRPQHHCWRLAVPVSRRRGGGVRRKRRRRGEEEEEEEEKEEEEEGEEREHPASQM